MVAMIGERGIRRRSFSQWEMAGGGNIAREFVFLYNAQVLLNSYIKILFKQF